MTRTQRTVLLLGLLAPITLAACRQKTGTVEAAPAAPPSTSVDLKPNAVTLTAGSTKLMITAPNEHVVRVRATSGAAFRPDFSWAVLPGVGAPHVDLHVENTEKTLVIATPALRVQVDKSPLRVTFLDAGGRVISEDDPRRPMTIDRSGGFRVTKTMPADEHYYGLGDKAGSLDRRGRAFANWNVDAFGWQESTDPLYKTIPFYVALRKGKAHGIFVDNTWRTAFDFGREGGDFASFAAEGGELDYYFIDGPAPKDVVTRYTELTGRTPLPPLWSLGYQQCRYSYYPQARVEEIARTLRQKKIPADVIYLDIDYQKNNRPFTVDRERFPGFESMIRDLGTQGFKIIAITDLHLAKLPDTGYAPYDLGKAGNHFVHNADGSLYVGEVWPGASVFPDFTWAPARKWWGTLYKDFVGMGIAGFWNDMNEPSIFGVPTKTMPLDVVHRVDSGGTATHREVHNVYGMQNSRATYDGLRALRPDRRPMVLTRASYAGGQRYAASWTGDNSSTWSHYRISIPTLLSLGISGYPLVGDDIGGFAGSPTPELLTRWFELGAFNPIYRDHTNKGTLDQEPWVHGAEHEAIRRRYIEARYELLPYLYTQVEAMSRTGMPLMRPMFFERPDDEEQYGNDRMFFFGPDLLVEPKMDETLDPVGLVVPEGIWYDYWTGEKQTGPANKKIQPALGELPVLVRGGAIVPRQPLVQSTSEVPKGPLELRVYPGPNCGGSLYLDDGTTFEYEKGSFLRLRFTCTEESGAVKVRVEPAEGSFVPWFGSVRVVVYGGAVGRKPASATVPYDKAGFEISIAR
jgi:alpha-glucosidase